MHIAGMNKPKYLVIDAGGSKYLTEAVVAIITAATGRKVIYESGSSESKAGFIYLEFERGCFAVSPRGTTWDSGSMNPTKIDARTQMGELVELFEPKNITILHLARESGGTYRDGVISHDKKTLTVGCSTVTREKVKEAYEAMFS